MSALYTARAERDEALRKLRELAGLARAAVGDDYQGDVDPLVDWLQAHTELWGGFPDEDALAEQPQPEPQSEQVGGITDVEWLAGECGRLRTAGCQLATAALRVIETFDGVHRLALAVSKWTKALADEGGRTALDAQGGDTPAEGPWRVEGGDVRSTLTNDDLSYWIEEPKIEALTLAALLNAGAAAERRVKELEAQGKQPHGICAEPPYQRQLREERDDLRKQLGISEAKVAELEKERHDALNRVADLEEQLQSIYSRTGRDQIEHEHDEALRKLRDMVREEVRAAIGPEQPPEDAEETWREIEGLRQTRAQEAEDRVIAQEEELARLREQLRELAGLANYVLHAEAWGQKHKQLMEWLDAHPELLTPEQAQEDKR